MFFNVLKKHDQLEVIETRESIETFQTQGTLYMKE